MEGDDPVHEFKNHLSVIVGFCDMLLRELADDDRMRHDVVEIQRAALAAAALLSRVAARLDPRPDA